MNSRRTPVLTFIILGLVMGLCICAGCTSGPSEENQTVETAPLPVDIGFVQVHDIGVQDAFSLSDAASAIAGKFPETNGSSLALPVYYIRGEGVDDAGQASRWIFGIKEGKNTSLMVYDRSGVSQIPWIRDRLPEKAISISGILPPENIMEMTHAGNISETGQPAIEIADGIYTVTEPPGSHPRVYTIDALSGELIATHDE